MMMRWEKCELMKSIQHHLLIPAVFTAKCFVTPVNVNVVFALKILVTSVAHAEEVVIVYDAVIEDVSGFRVGSVRGDTRVVLGEFKLTRRLCIGGRYLKSEIGSKNDRFVRWVWRVVIIGEEE